MSLETALYAALTPICPRVFPDEAPYATDRPYITWQQIGGDVTNFTDNQVPDNENAHIQIDVWDDTRHAAKELLKLVEAALIQSTTLQARPMAAAVAANDEDTDRRGFMQDFSIWAPR